MEKNVHRRKKNIVNRRVEQEKEVVNRIEVELRDVLVVRFVS